MQRPLLDSLMRVDGPRIENVLASSKLLGITGTFAADEGLNQIAHVPGLVGQNLQGFTGDLGPTAVGLAVDQSPQNVP